MTLHDEYNAALMKIMAAPLTLTEKDFAVLEAFNPADERRGRDAVRRVQLAIVANREALQTKAIAPPARVPPVRHKQLGQIAEAIGEIGRRLAALEGKTATVAELRKELVAVRASLLAIQNPSPDAGVAQREFDRRIQH